MFFIGWLLQLLRAPCSTSLRCCGYLQPNASLNVEHVFLACERESRPVPAPPIILIT